MNPVVSQRNEGSFTRKGKSKGKELYLLAKGPCTDGAGVRRKKAYHWGGNVKQEGRKHLQGH